MNGSPLQAAPRAANRSAHIAADFERSLREHKALEGKSYAPPHLRQRIAELDAAFGEFVDGHECPVTPVDYSKCNLTFEGWPADECQWELASQSLRALEGRVFIEMGSAPVRFGGLALPPELASQSRPDVGTVIAACPASRLKPGDVVAVVAMDGTSRIGFTAGAYAAKNEVFSYGVYCDDAHRGAPELYPLEYSILATLHRPPSSRAFYMRPYGSRLFVRQDAVQTAERGLVLPDSEHYRTNVGTVVSVGPDVLEVKPGDRVIYTPNACISFVRHGQDEDAAIMLESAIEAILP